MTDNDILFIQQLMNAGKNNRESEEKKTLTTHRNFLSDKFLKALGVKNDCVGFWFGNVYIEFTPSIQILPAKDWQK